MTQLVCILAALFSTGCVTVNRLIPTLTPTASLTEQGRQVFERVCAACHGLQGEGHANDLNAPPLNHEGKAWVYPNSRIESIIRDGGRVMPALGEQLSPAEIQSVIAFLHIIWEQTP